MAIKALTGLEPEWFEPERYVVDSETGDMNEVPVDPEEVITGFKIRPLTGSEYYEVAQDQGLRCIKQAFRMGLIGWRNFTNRYGEELKFSKPKASEVIPAKYQISIGRRIIEISSFDGETEKNS